MKKIIIRYAIYLLPIFTIILSILLIDPYYLWHSNDDFSQNKYKIGYSYDQGHRYKIFSYLKNPKEKIILGASEINRIDERNIPEDGWQSLSFGGAQIEETIDLFWFIANNYQLSDVIIAPEFIKYYNSIIKGDITYYNWKATQSFAAIDLFNNQTEVLLDKYTILSTFDYFASFLMKSSSQDIPNMSKSEFWEHQLNYAKQQFFCRVDDSKKKQTLQNLEDISIYLRERGIKSTIIIPVQHLQLIQLEYSDSVYPIYREYLSHLVRYFGRVYYFDYPNEISTNNELFSDPFHYSESSLYLNTFWGDTNPSIFKLLQSDNDIAQLDSIRYELQSERND